MKYEGSSSKIVFLFILEPPTLGDRGAKVS